MILKNKITIAIVLALCGTVAGQTKSFTPVEGANLKARIESAIVTGKASSPNGRFWLEVELQKQAVLAIGRRAKDEAVPVLIRTARNHPKMAVRKLAVQVLG